MQRAKQAKEEQLRQQQQCEQGAASSGDAVVPFNAPASPTAATATSAATTAATPFAAAAAAQGLPEQQQDWAASAANVAPSGGSIGSMSSSLRGSRKAPAAQLDSEFSNLGESMDLEDTRVQPAGSCGGGAEASSLQVARSQCVPPSLLAEFSSAMQLLTGCAPPALLLQAARSLDHSVATAQREPRHSLTGAAALELRQSHGRSTSLVSALQGPGSRSRGPSSSQVLQQPSSLSRSSSAAQRDTLAASSDMGGVQVGAGGLASGSCGGS
jgi:hypothetical protein